MADLEAVRVDAFTEYAYSGNPVWVVMGADGLDDVQLQRVAYELGGPVTAFVLRSRKADLRLRYFSPGAEEPISGHATIGALWAVRASAGSAPVGTGRRRVETPVGVLPFSVEANSEGIERIWMTQKKPLFAKVDEVKEVASALGVGAESLFHDAFPITRASTGMPCLLVSVRSLDVLGRVEPKVSEMTELAEQLEVADILVYAWGVIDSESALHARCFTLLPDFFEDIASGMPAGALCAYLVEHDFVPKAKASNIVLEQGRWLSRPSKIHVRVEKKGASVQKVEVGGSARITMRGRVQVP